MRKRYLIVMTLALGIALGGCAAVTDQGLRNALRPEAAGLYEIAPETYIDDRARADEARALLAAARRQVAGFFGGSTVRPRIILCTTAACKAKFLPPRGLHGKTLGYQLVMVDAKGFSQVTLAHELAHAELHRRVSIGTGAGRVPAWFGEGLASWISDDAGAVTPTAPQIARVKQARLLPQWAKAASQIGWLNAYAASKALVAGVADTAGLNALRGLVSTVAAGGDFDTLWARLPGAR